MKHWMIGIILLLGISHPAFGAEHYVTSGGAGAQTGADWSNASAGLPAELTRGDTYYISEGTYAPYTLDDALSGTDVITIKKCGPSDTTCTSADGYVFSDNDDQAVFLTTTNGPAFELQYGYVVIDGVTGGGPEQWTAGHGIKFTSTFTPTTKLEYGSPLVSVRCPNLGVNAADHFTIQHSEFAHIGREYNCFVTGDCQGIKISGDSVCADNPDTITLRYNYFHDNPTGVVWLFRATNLTYEYNWMESNATKLNSVSPACTSSTQGAGLTTYGLQSSSIRHSVFKNIEGSLVIPLYSWHGRYDVSGIDVYGNLFYWEENHDPALKLENAFVGGDGCRNEENPCDGSDLKYSDIYVYNNTFANLNAYKMLWIDPVVAGSDIYAHNNIFFQNEGVTIANGEFAGFNHDYNWFFGNVAYQNGTTDIDAGCIADETGGNGHLGSSSPFMDWQNHDFQLSNATPPGDDAIGLAYGADAYGISRGADSVWDRGAYEYHANAATIGNSQGGGSGGCFIRALYY